MSDGPLPAYRAYCHAGDLSHDPAQALAAEKLQGLYNALRHYRPSDGAEGWLSRLGLVGSDRGETPQGLYLFGPVGRGKSMLMDMFYDGVAGVEKRRVHFHEFMIEVHAALNDIRRNGGEQDPLRIVSADIAAEAWLLCFDEFQVDNIVDAMILGRLFQGLFENGVVVVATSNAAPDALYRNGLQRDRFVPFIELIGQRLDVLELDGAVDYRRDRLTAMRLYHTPLGPDADAALNDAFAQLTAAAPPAPYRLLVRGRSVEVPKCARGVAQFSFAELCQRPLGAADYLAIAKRFHTVILDRIPLLPPAKRNEAKRFVTLIDTLYEHRVNFVCSAEGRPDALYSDGDGSDVFQRAVSRLLEMQGEAYIGEGHVT